MSKEVRVVEAAGGVLYRVNANNEIEVCLVHRPKYDDWSFPKGKLELNESFRHAAVREMSEETGFNVTLGPYLGEVEYPLNDEGKKTRKSGANAGVVKHVQYWMARIISHDDVLHLVDAFGPVHHADAHEINNIQWLTIAQARKILTHSTDKDMLALFVDRIEEGAAHYGTLLLVRHAKAESRKTWDGTDENRPITPKGAAAAYALDRELACYNPTKLVTSPWMRCLQTLQMLSWQTKRPLHHVQALTEDAFAQDPARAWRVFRDELSGSLNHEFSASVVCMHRPVIGGIFEQLRELCETKTLRGQLVDKSPYMPTANALALFVVQREDGLHIIDIQKVSPLVY